MTPRRILTSAAPLTVSLVILLAWLPATLAGPVPVPRRATVSVSAVDNSFQPQTVTIQVGDTVVWTNNGLLPHTSTSDSAGTWDSGILSSGQSFSRTFDTAGTFPYHCTIHQALGMVGAVVVQAAAQATATSAPAQPTATTAAPTATAAAPTATATPPSPTATAAPPATTPTSAPTAIPTATLTPAQPAPAVAPSIKITAPQDCSATNFDINLSVDITNFTLSEGNIGKANAPGQGHYALFVDGQLRRQVGTPSLNVQDLSPGLHTIRVQLVNNDNTPLVPSIEDAVSIAVPSPGGAVTLPAACGAATPSPAVLPKAGDSALPPWVLLVAGSVIVVGLAVRSAARR